MDYNKIGKQQAFIEGSSVPSVVQISYKKNHSQIIGTEWAERYETESQRGLIEQDIQMAVGQFYSNIMDIPQWQLDELRDLQNLKPGTYFLDVGDFSYTVDIEARSKEVGCERSREENIMTKTINMQQVKDSSAKRPIDVMDLCETVHMVKEGCLKDGPFTLYEQRQDGTRAPFEVSREHFLDFILEAAVTDIYDLMEDYLDDEGELDLVGALKEVKADCQACKIADKNKQENLKILALDLDNELNAIGCDVIALNDIRELVAHLRIKMDNIDEKDARLYFNEFHRSVRVLDELCVSAMDSLNTNHAAAQEIKQEIFNNTTSKEKAGSSLIGMIPMTPERDREIAMEYNHKAFMQEFGRVPFDEKEVIDWVSKIVADIKNGQ
ncbi:hypothetical protein [Sporosarcina limicola]|uniref:Uncharacterized protein n=1 Tax=Sporosarcina limicola TaxID=34101 RepID=A0A927MTD7_9BACL|nr:hypothetical protein [Sporosarcina limicola]MBE1557006.1 hypothetical protein [Sporosarcina limicola]